MTPPKPVVTPMPAKLASATVIVARPAATVSFVPMRATIRGASGDTTMTGTALARSRTPVWSALRPSTNCRYCVRRKIAPNSAKNVTAIAPLAALKRGLAQKRRSSIGCSTCASQAKKAVSTTPPIAKAVRMVGSVQPWVGASITAYSSAHRPTMERIAPTQSSRGALGSRESGIRNAPARRPTATMGRFTRKIEPQ